MFKNLGLRSRIALPVIVISIAIVGLLIAFQMVRTVSIIKSEALKTAEETSYHYANAFQNELALAMDTARVTAQNFETLKSQGNVDRELFARMLSNVLEKNPKFLGIWTCWEPQALDGKDATFAGKPGHDQTGRFIPYYNRAAGNISLEALADYDKPGAGDYYLVPLKSGMELAVEPFWYEIAALKKKVYVTSLVVPVRVGGSVLGVVGVDLDLAKIQEVVSGVRPYETGWAALISNTGLYAAHNQTDLIGKNQGESQADPKFKEELTQKVAHGTALQTIHVDPATKLEVLSQFVPVAIGNSKSPWSFNVNIPMKKVMEKPNQMLWSSIVTGFVGIGLLALVTILLANRIARPINATVDMLSESSDQIASASRQVADSSHSLAEGASEQAASLEETSSSLEEMSSMTLNNSEGAQKANELTRQARVAAEAGTTDMKAMNLAMDAIQASSNDIAKIIKTIDEIAFQTNILALNAAVEAARAGEAGMGFAVVAEEVRNLAQRSAQAARETTQKIEGAIKNAKEGVAISSKVASGLQEISAKVRQIDELVAEVATASKEQSQGISQVNTAVSQMDKVTQSNAANAEESASAAQELNAQAQSLKVAVSQLMEVVAGADGAAARTHSEESSPARFSERRNGATNGKTNSHVDRRNGAPARKSNDQEEEFPSLRN